MGREGVRVGERGGEGWGEGMHLIEIWFVMICNLDSLHPRLRGIS